MQPHEQLSAVNEKFRLMQAELHKLTREFGQISPAVAQSAALQSFRKWVDKSDRVLQQLLELRT